MEPTNLYFPGEGTSIPNAGSGSNSLTKPAGTATASIYPGDKYSTYVGSAVTFDTDFYSDTPAFTVWFYAKPNIGTVADILGHKVVFSGYSFTVSNDAGESIEIPVRSARAHLFILTYANHEFSVHVGSGWASVEGNTITDSGQIAVSLLEAGGILHTIGAVAEGLSDADTLAMQIEYGVEAPVPASANLFSDSSRDEVVQYKLIDNVTVTEGVETFPIPSSDCLGFKVEYNKVGDGEVYANAIPIASGGYIDGPPFDLSVSSHSSVNVSAVLITEYYSQELGETSGATFLVDGSTGNDHPAFWHDDLSLSVGETTVTPDGTSLVTSGWFKVADGSPLPGVTMSNGVLTGTNLLVNAQPYSGGTLHDWYFLTTTEPISAPFVIDVPVHAVVMSETAMTNNEIDDLYESLLGNPSVIAEEEALNVSDLEAVILSTEWNIVTSG